MRSFLLSTLLLWVSSLSAAGQTVWNLEHLREVGRHLDEPVYAEAYRCLLQRADEALEMVPPSVMQKNKCAASGNKHDYLSQARYFWPDPSKPDGLPYVNRDGESNPEIEQLDRYRLSEMAEGVQTLSLAHALSHDGRYARKAVELLRTWFLDKTTRMNPHLEYAQMVPGVNGGKGRSYGVLDTYSFVEMLSAVRLLEENQALPKADSQGLRRWFSRYTKWMLTSRQGKEEFAATNNHGTAYDAQVIAYALYTGDRQTARRFLDGFYERRVLPQIAADGRQPLELDRTLAFGYSVYNLSHILDVLQLGQSVAGPTLERVELALDYLLPYLGEGRQAWPYQQIGQWPEKQQELCVDLYRTWLLDTQCTAYRQACDAHLRKDWADPFFLLYFRPTQSDHAFAAADRQLRFAVACADKALAEGGQPGKVSPRCMEPDGRLRLVGPKDWCSGFFAGNLWQLYAYTHNDYWKEQAERYMWPIASAQWHRGTHDLGFMLYDSFGKGYGLTGDTAQRSVVIQAARTLISRYDSRVGCIRSWDHNQEVWKYPVIIDNMMNLEMLFEVARMTGDSTFYQIAVNHANTTLRNHFRADNSSYHVVDYDPETGQVRMKVTCQGIADESVWSRGQGWGLYGFAMCYRYTHDDRYLEQARNIARYVFSLDRMPADLVPYWDMLDPAIPEAPRDASAAAVLACGLYELADCVEGEEREGYVALADRIVESLYRDYRAKTGTTQGFLLLHSVGNYPAHDEIDVPIIYADYYYLEALARKYKAHMSAQRSPSTPAETMPPA